jgi:hypothetical protein
LFGSKPHKDWLGERAAQKRKQGADAMPTKGALERLTALSLTQRAYLKEAERFLL